MQNVAFCGVIVLFSFSAISVQLGCKTDLTTLIGLREA